MLHNNSEEINQKIALFKYEQIIPILNNEYPDKSVLAYCKRIAQTPFQYVDGTSKNFSYQTIRYWYDLYRHHGFKALYPKQRSDVGTSRCLTKLVKEKVIKLKKANPRLTATSIYLTLIEDGDIYRNDVSLSTLTRFIATIKPNLHLSSIEDMRAFEMEHTNDLWQIDTSYCSYITIDGKRHRTYLIMIVDDHSRMVVGFGFYLEDNAINVQATIKKAIQKYGIPKRIYTDNGTPYRNEQLSLICAELQIRLSRTQVYHGNQKGKVERAFLTIKTQWMYITDFNLFHNCEEINASFSDYIQRKNNTVHSSLSGKTPLSVFMADSQSIRRIDPERLEQLFYHTVTRKVANDATIRLLGKQFETNQNYIGSKIVIKYIPNLSHVYIFENDSYIEIVEVNKIENARIKRKPALYSRGDDND